MTDDLIPHKAMLARLRLSRTSVWRALRCGGDRFPKPVIVRRRMHWRVADLARIEAAMAAYGGRGDFDMARRSGCVAVEPRNALRTARKRRAPRRKKAANPDAELGQLDLFDPA